MVSVMSEKSGGGGVRQQEKTPLNSNSRTYNSNRENSCSSRSAAHGSGSVSNSKDHTSSPNSTPRTRNEDRRDARPYKPIDNGFRLNRRPYRDDDRRNGTSKLVPRKPVPNPQNISSSSRHSSPSNSNRKDCPDAVKKPSAILDASKSFQDESRLSKLVRRIKDGDRERRVIAAKQLRDYLLTVEGSKAANRIANDTLAILQSIFNERGYTELKHDVAKCIGIIGWNMGKDAIGYFQWLFTQTNNAVDDDGKSYYLLCLLETLKYDERKHNLAEFMPLVLSNVQTMLENADSPDLLKAVVDVLLPLARMYPHVFSSVFKDTVDILVGWHIDSTQKDSLTDYTSQALVSFRDFWASDIAFSVTLLGQFLEDMEAYSEDLGIGMSGKPTLDEEIPTPQECIIKIGALLKVFTTVVRSLGENFSPSIEGGITKEYMVKVVDRIVTCIDSTVRFLYSEDILRAVNHCLGLLIHSLENSITHTWNTLLPFLITQVFTDKRVSNKYAVSLLGIIHKVIEMFGVQLPVNFLSELLSPGSLLHYARFSHDTEVLTSLMTVYHCIMGLKSVPLLEEAYRIVLGDIQTSFSILWKDCSSEEFVVFVKDHPFENVQYSIPQAKASIHFCLCALAEIGNTKNNLIGMWALTPSIFELFTFYLVPRSMVLAEKYPSIQYTIVHALYSHCIRHGNFISSSSLLTQNAELEGSLLTNVSSTKGHFLSILKLLSQDIDLTESAFDVKYICLKWILDITQDLKSTSHIFFSAEFDKIMAALISLGHENEVEIKLSSCKCLQNILKTTTDFLNSFLLRCLGLCLSRMNDNNAEVKEAFVELLELLPLDIWTSNCNISGLEDCQQAYQQQNKQTGLIASWLGKKNHMNQVPLGTFHSHNFCQIMSALLNGNPPSQSSNMSWLEAMYYTSQRKDKENDRSHDNVLPLSAVLSNESSFWFWATWEAAQFCVLARLRTPLGKPQDTFMSIESVVKSFAAEVLNSGPDEENINRSDTQKGDRKKQITKGTRVRVLLDFLEQLEKLLYNAYEGCAVALTSAPKVVRTFFRTNRGTCLEWLSRIRMSLIIVSLHNGADAFTIRQAYELLREMKDNKNTQGHEFEKVLMYLVQALCELKCPESIHGLYAWCKDVIGKKLPWIKTAAEKASGRYDQAADEYKCILKSLAGIVEQDEEGDSSMFSADNSPRNLLDETGHKKMILKTIDPESKVLSFTANEVIECYMCLNDWDAAIEWQESLNQYRSDPLLSTIQSSKDFDTNYIRALSSFDSLDLSGVHECMELIPGASFDFGKKDSLLTEKWSPKELQIDAHTQFIKAATLILENKVNSHKNELIKSLQNSEILMRNVIELETMDWPLKISSQCMTEMNILSVIRKQLEDQKGKTFLTPLSSKLEFNAAQQDIGVYQQAMRLINVQLKIPGTDRKSELYDKLSSLKLASSSMCRKQHNFHLAENLLLDHINLLMRNNSENGRIVSHDSLMMAISSLRGTNGGVNHSDILRVEREAAKLLFDTGIFKDGLDILTMSVVGYFGFERKQKDDLSSCGELCSRSLLNLVKWLQADYKNLSVYVNQLRTLGDGDNSGISSVTRNLKIILDIESAGAQKRQGLVLDEEEGVLKIGENPILTENDSIIGRIQHLSTIECPEFPKAWFALAGWCYKWGRKAVDNASHGSVELSGEERGTILSLLPKGTSNEEIEKVLHVLSQIHVSGSSEEDISDEDQSLYDDGAETTRKQLLSCCLSLQIASDECLERLLNVWRGVVKRVYHYYQLSAKAYFIYLQLNGTNQQDNNEDGNIVATLRLLRLLVKHAWELRSVLETGLASTPTAPWKGIIPQLFSRLSHPETYVRQSVSDLLCRVAHDAPHLILYPAVVGCSTKKSSAKEENQEGLLKNYLRETDDGEEDVDQRSQDEEEEESNIEDETSNKMLQNCLKSIVETLSQNNPKMITEVQLLIQELRRITLLWDELWLGTLNQHHQDITRRLTQLESEVKKVHSNKNLAPNEKTAIIREKHKTVMKPTLYVLERLQEITSQPPETPHEEAFQTTYGQIIIDALEKLRKPADPGKPLSSWHSFKQFHNSLQQRAQKRSSFLLRMDEISPKLANMKDTLIAMPGVVGSVGEMITVKSVYGVAQILPTKTKPKKLIFLGSDGKRYPYLFKGLEDLHLDERIMQFMTIVNNMFAKSNKREQQIYRARHYSVTPLGPRSGLIQWVDGATPLFGLYKRWQQREAVAQTLKDAICNAVALQMESCCTQGMNYLARFFGNGAVNAEVLCVAHDQQASGGGNTNSSNSNPTSILRPSEIFYNKLTPVLKEKDIGIDNRKDWPMSVLRKILEELMEETPKDLLSRELWCSSTCPNEWWSMTQTYSRSTAVMSMIGYIIGLGDRHLDNVLVDLVTGEVVHIDYNVCFEKGKGLRVPEKVPFRMTQNIQTALGVTGVEKGKGLRVPEKVPFRMTQNIQTALGVTGVEGTFRIASENVIKTMRKGRETLLTLLEAFVYDPLVDWTTGNEGGYTGAFYGGGLTSMNAAGDSRLTKREMEREITLSMFSIRIAEMKAQWMENKEELENAIPVLEDFVQKWIEMAGDYHGCLSNTENLSEIKSLLFEALSDASHPIYNLVDRFQDYSIVKTTRESVNRTIEEKINEYSHWQKVHRHVLKSLQGQVFQKMCADVAKALDLEPPSFAAATEFLQGAGQGQIVSQCEQLEGEFMGLVQHRRSVLHNALDILHTYASVVTQFGLSFADDNRTNRYLMWLQDLLCDFTSDKCAEIITRFHEIYRPASTPPNKTQLIFNTEMKLQGIVNDVKGRLVKLLERRGQEGVETTLLQIQVNEADTSIQCYVQENGFCGVSSLISVVVTALCTLNKRYLMMEGAAAAAGDRLMDLTSRDGDWFLDELCSMSGNVNQFLDILKNNTLVTSVHDFTNLSHALQATHNVYSALQELNNHFRTIILPEALKAMQAQEPSVLSALEDMEKIIKDIGYPLESLISQLEVLHRNAIMGIENENLEPITIVKRLSLQFNELLHGGMDRERSDLSPGQMLLMGFNGLFTRLEDEFTYLMESMDSLEIPEIWRKVDAVREAKSMQLSSFTSNTRNLLSTLFFVKRIQSMQEFFHMCTQFSVILQGLDGGGCFDDEQLAKPVKKFIADYVRKQVIGFPSQVLGYILCVLINELGVNVTAEIELKDIGAESKVPLDDLCKKAVDTCLRNTQYQHVHLTQASTLTSTQDSSWRKLDLARRLDGNIVLMRASHQRAQLQLARFQWLHEDIFTQSGRPLNQFVMPNRATVMSEMKKSMKALNGQEGTLVSCQERYSQLESSIVQRLRWAAGANPSLNLVLQQFEEASNIRKHVFEEEGHRTNEVVHLCQGIIHLEALRTCTQEAVSSDNNFITLLNRCSEAAMMQASTETNVSELEDLLMQTKPPGDGQRINNEWIQTTVNEVQSQIKELRNRSKTLRSQLGGVKDDIKTQVSVIRNILSTHHKLMSDIRAVLKSMAKQEEQDFGEQTIPGGIREYLSVYKNFSENFTTALKGVISDDAIKDGMVEAKSMLDGLKNQVSQIYEELISFAPHLLQHSEDSDDSEKSFATALKKSAELDFSSPVKRFPHFNKELLTGTQTSGSQSVFSRIGTPVAKKVDKISRDPRTGKAVQERNSYAVGVWRRVKMKLEGRDPDPTKRMTVAEQVDYVIKEATSLDNLAVLYEGWTPWV